VGSHWMDLIEHISGVKIKKDEEKVVRYTIRYSW